MQNQLEIVVLANSVKHKNHCVAGKLTSDRSWVRPVSNENGAELTDSQVRYQNPYGKFLVKTLQIIKISYIKKVPLLNQPENYLIDNNIWVQNYSIKENEIVNYLDHPKDLWGASNKVSMQDINNKLITINQSLYLISVENLKLFSNQQGKRRASFIYNKIPYELPVTDPKFENLKTSPPSSLKNILCISLGEVFNGSCFKLIAAIY